MHRKIVGRIVDAASRYPFVVLAIFAVLFAVLGTYAQKLQNNVRTDFLELLPRDSPRFRAFEHQLGRVGGAAKLVIVVTSPDRKQNERFVDDLASRVAKLSDEKKACAKTCAPNDGECQRRCFDPVAYVESGTKDVRDFYDSHKWLFADLKDLEDASRNLDRQIAMKIGLVENLDDDAPPSSPGLDPKPAPKVAPKPAPKPLATGDAGAGDAGIATASQPAAPGGPADAGAADSGAKSALGVTEYLDRWDERANRKDTFPTGYFATDDGQALGLKIVTNTTLGDARGDAFLVEVQRIVAEMGVKEHFHPEMQVGFTGDIGNASDEKKALVDDATKAFLVALGIILLVLVVYYRSLWALVVIFVPAFFGIVAAYAFAYAVFGYINTAGAFLAAIILGNGLNYPVVLLSRYQEFRARGMEPDEAKREAVLNALRAELVGAMVASIAYGSLVITRFRGFNQFGMIGFFGMITVWAAIIPLVPALLAINEKVQSFLPKILREPAPKLRDDGSRSIVTKLLADVTTRYPWPFVIFGAVVTVFAATRIPSYIGDPWEYDFGKLGSRATHQVGGANHWSNKANEVFGGKMNIAGALMLADTPEQVPALKKQILENDRNDPQGPLLADIATIWDLLPGTPEEQEKKLEQLEQIRDLLTPRVMQSLSEEERKKVERFKPPSTLHVLTVKDVPPLLKRPFSENNGNVGTVVYVKIRNDVVLADAHYHLRLSATCDNVRLPDGTVVQTATTSSIYADIIDSIRRDGPLASAVSFFAVLIVVIVATRNWRGATAVIVSLLIGVIWLAGAAAYLNVRINYVNFIAFPITFGIGCEYPFNISDRARLLNWNVREAVIRSSGAVILCSFTTVVGYGSGMFSDFQALESFGKLAVIGELACVFAAVLFMPSFLTLLQRSEKKTATAGGLDAPTDDHANASTANAATGEQAEEKPAQPADED